MSLFQNSISIQNGTSVCIHYATYDTRLTHGHRKLRLAEDFEMLRMTPVLQSAVGMTHDLQSDL